VNDQPETQDGQSVPAAGDVHVPAQASPQPATSWTPADAPASDAATSPAPGGDRPEVAVGAAFAGGFLLAMILRRLAR
jgi:hypothetical protein